MQVHVDTNVPLDDYDDEHLLLTAKYPQLVLARSIFRNLYKHMKIHKSLHYASKIWGENVTEDGEYDYIAHPDYSLDESWNGNKKAEKYEEK